MSRMRTGRGRGGGRRVLPWIVGSAAATLVGACADPVEVEQTGPIGALTIEATTTGPAQDGDGYVLLWNGAVAFHVPPNDARTVTVGVNGRPIELEMDGVADNCAPAGGPLRVVTPSSEPISPVRFEVRCSVPPELANVRIVLVRDGDLYSERLDGQDRVQLAFTGASNSPSVSRDGGRIAYVAAVRTPWNGEIRIMNVDGTDDRALTTSGEAYYPSFSPFGSAVAFVEGNRWSGALRIRSLDTEEATELLTSPTNSELPPQLKAALMTPVRGGGAR